MSQSGSEGFSQKQENILQNIQANTFNFAPTQIIQIVREKVTQRELIKASPYKGLYKFNFADQDKFFGRDALIQRFLNAVNISPLSLILGASGSGKSSVIRAGVIPKFKRSLVGMTFYDFIIEPGEDPFASLYGCFLNNEKDYQFTASDVKFLRENSAETLPRAIKQLKNTDQYWLFFIDQFEQLFTNCGDAEMRENFIDGLVQVANLRDSSVRIVLGMRADFSEYLSAYPALGEILNQNNIHLVTDMHLDELRQVIEQPAAKHGVVFEEGLVEQIIKDVQGQSGSLPLLQYTLDLLWNTECQLTAADGRPHIEDRILNTCNYNALEGVRGALQKCVNKIYQDQDHQEKIATKQIFLRLVNIVNTESGSRAVSRIASRSEFASASQQKVLADLIEANLLVSDSKYLSEENVVINQAKKRQQVATVELAHEILLSSWDALRYWLDEEKKTIILKNWLADEAQRWNKIKGQDESKAKDELVKGSRLDEIVIFRQADGFSKLGGLSLIENEYIDASVAWRDWLVKQEEARRQKELRQARYIAIGATVALMFMAGVTGLAVKQQKESVIASIEAIKNNSDYLRETGQTFVAWIETLKGVSKLQENNLLGNFDLFLKSEQLWQNFIKYLPGNSQIQDTDLITKSHHTSMALGVAINNAINTMDDTRNNQYTIFNVLEHSSTVTSVSFSPDGKTIASASEDKTVKLWNRQGKLLHTLTGHFNPMNIVIFSPDGETIASTSYDKTIKLWNTQGQLLSEIVTNHSEGISSVSFSPDGKTIASASEDKTVKLWNRQGKLLRTLTGHSQEVNSVTFSPDGETIASGSYDRTIKLWNRQGKLLHTLTGHSESVNSVSFSPDSETIASASKDSTVKLWNRQGKLLHTLTGHSNVVTSVNFSPDGKTIISASSDKTVKLWNPQGKLLHTLTGHSDVVISAIFSPDGQTIASGSGDNTVKLWNRQAKFINTLTGHSNNLTSVSFSPDGNTLASGSGDKTVKLWNRQGKLLNTLTGHSESVNSVSFSPDSQTIGSASSDKTVKLWNNQGKLLHTLTGHSEGVRSVSFSPDRETIASASYDKTVKLWNHQGKLLHTLTGHSDVVTNVSFSPDSQTIASASWDNTVKLWNRQGKLINTLTGHNAYVNSVSFSPDGQTIASASWDNTVKLWNRQGKLINTLTSYVTSVSFSPDGNTIASASWDKTVKLWNMNLKDLQEKSCEYLHDYLVNNPNKLTELTICQNK